MGSKVNYIALLFIIIAGVAVGNFVSNWIMAEIIEGETEKSTDEISKDVTKQTNKTKQKIKKQQEVLKIQEVTKEDINEEFLIEQRKIDDHGIRLAKNCSEWQVAHKDMQTQTSERGMIKHCDYYQQYIKTGKLPPLN